MFSFSTNHTCISNVGCRVVVLGDCNVPRDEAGGEVRSSAPVQSSSDAEQRSAAKNCVLAVHVNTCFDELVREPHPAAMNQTANFVVV